MQIREEELSPDHLKTAETRKTIATLHLEQGKHAEALKVYKDVLTIKEKVLGCEHPGLGHHLHHCTYMK